MYKTYCIVRSYMEFYTKIVGVTFDNRQRLIWELKRDGTIKEGTELVLSREPNNPYDRNAIAVLTTNGDRLGYLSKNTVACQLAPKIDSGQRFGACVTSITGGDVGNAFGINIKIFEQKEEFIEPKSFWLELYSNAEYELDGNMRTIFLKATIDMSKPNSEEISYVLMVSGDGLFGFLNTKNYHFSMKMNRVFSFLTTDLYATKEIIKNKLSYFPYSGTSKFIDYNKDCINWGNTLPDLVLYPMDFELLEKTNSRLSFRFYDNYNGLELVIFEENWLFKRCYKSSALSLDIFSREITSYYNSFG